MKNKVNNNFLNELDQLCATVRTMVAGGKYESCMESISKAMERNPHAPHPHNLLGIVLEKMGNHTAAMKHFRAAWALDPTYAPASYNLHTYGTFSSSGRCAFDESDIPPVPSCKTEIIYDDRGVGHVVSKRRFGHDMRGKDHAVRR